MTFIENIQTFFTLLINYNFDLLRIYSENPNSIFSTFIAFVVIVLISIFFIKKTSKNKDALNIITNINKMKNISEHTSKLSKLASTLPKTNIKVAISLNEKKDELLKQELISLQKLSIADKISKYKEIASQYKIIAENTKKYKIKELVKFYEEKSKSLLEENLLKEIIDYLKKTIFNKKEIKNINTIIQYANSYTNGEKIIKTFTEEFEKFSLNYNVDLFIFTRELSKNYNEKIFKNCNNKINILLNDNNKIISEAILFYMINNDEKAMAYNYITNLKAKDHFKILYKRMFGKTNNINLDLAFIANTLKIKNKYHSYIDNKISKNWKDLTFLKIIAEAEGITRAIGHISYRSVLERIETLELQSENNKSIAEALTMAQEAYNKALEAITISKNK